MVINLKGQFGVGQITSTKRTVPFWRPNCCSLEKHDKGIRKRRIKLYDERYSLQDKLGSCHDW